MSELTVFDRDPYPAEQFAEPAQQDRAATMGMWTFLATEVLFFGGMFLSFYAYRLRWGGAFAEGARELKWWLGTINTAVLLGSSFCMALAVHASRGGDGRAIVPWLLLTAVLGVVFLGIKGTEYVIEYHEHLVPALNYSPVSPDGRPRAAEVQLFMTFYFVMTGFHALHMVIGLGVIGVLISMARSGKFAGGYNNPVDVGGLYWHFVDMVWVFLYPTLYLLRHA